MTQDTRKDPRAKVLTMTVRYKSATLDEFIEHHSHDVSRGGMFIKTPSPFPPGTLLKFEVKIAAEQRVMQGVGRVVWKREAAESNDVRPAGMGVKFIKIDDDSRKVIDQLITARGDTQSNFDQGSETPAAAAAVAAPRPAAPRPESTAPMPTPSAVPMAARGPARKSTMIGLGAMGDSSMSPQPPSATATPIPAATNAGFFPHSEMEMPAPEDRTVMKQAAELLQEALREAGGSFEDLGSSAKPPPATAKLSAPAASSQLFASDEVTTAAVPQAKAEPARAAAAALVDKPVSEKPAAAKPVAAEKPPVSVKPAAAAPARSAEPVKAKPSTSTRPAAVVQPAEAEGGGSKFLLAVAAILVVVGIVFLASRHEEAPPPPPTEAQPAPEPAAPPEPVPAAVEPTPPPAPEPPPSAIVPPEPVPAAPPPAPEPPPKAVAPAPAAPRPQQKVVAAPKAPALAPLPVASPSEPVAPPPEKPTAPTPPKAEEPPVVATPKPKPAPAPKKPAASEGDNPY